MQDMFLTGFLALVLLSIPMGIVYAIVRSRGQRRALQQLAAANGWTYEPKKTLKLPPEAAGLNIQKLQHDAHGDEVGGLVRGNYNGRAMCAFWWRPYYRGKGGGDIVTSGVVLLDRGQGAATLPDFSLYHGHALTDGMVKLSATLGQNARDSLFNQVELPEPLHEWRVWGVEGTRQWLHTLDATHMAQGLSSLGMSIHRVYGISGNTTFAHGSFFDADCLQEMLREVTEFSNLLEGLTSK